MKRCTSPWQAASAGLAWVAVAGLPGTLHAETLADAIALAYQSNPTLQSQRAQLRALDETYVQARTQFGPTLQGETSARYDQEKLRNSFSAQTPLPDSTTANNFGAAQVSLVQPVYTGGRATLDSRAAEWRIRAAREALRISEGDTVYAVIQAYVDVRRDAAALAIRRTNLAAIVSEVAEIHARQRAGEVTGTDVGQAEAQLAAEQANVAVAENQLRTSRIGYASVVGRTPGSLGAEPPLPNLPGSVEEAWQIADTASPEFQQALFNEEQSRVRIAAAATMGRPTISLRASAGYQASLFPFGSRNFDRSLSGSAVLSLPLFNSGYTRSLERQAGEQNSADRLQIEVVRRTLVQSTANAWNQMLTFRGNVAIEDRQIAAAEMAFRGMRVEYRAGQRSTLDVLVAEQTLRDAELARLAAEHDAYLSAALVLRYIGRLDAGSIVEALPRYDPAEHFSRVANRGAMPWEPLVRAVDGLLLPASRQHAIPAPDAAKVPVLSHPDASAVHSDTTDIIPLSPRPGTISGELPPISDDRPRH